MIRSINGHTFINVTQIHKGWSGDKKYYVENAEGQRYLLRTSDISEYEKKRSEFGMMRKFSEAGIKISLPMEFGVSDDRKTVYQLLSWIEGKEALEVLETLPEDKQYAYGKKAAAMLKEMENVDRAPASNTWCLTYKKKIEAYVKAYQNCSVSFEESDRLISYLRENVSRIGERPTSLMHEDFQTDNMMISPNGELYAVDFQMCGHIDPYLAMMSVGYTARSSVAFAMGQMDGYFGNEVPGSYWKLVAFYELAQVFHAYPVGIGLGGDEADEVRHIFDGVAERLDFDKASIPDWYADNRARFKGDACHGFVQDR
ncbi:phosphotransferase [Saccharibacter sp. 17.LH.SD]|uniref:aminoglycoside phosphotransferase family protein n=1 Tax=Saccharibacter sp. 17.LH.SD TaxID=2689393 RepID=UPI001371BD3D|nr:aminoglycoside phosphotransferase family protein [Saccharibacter sp. 17.LH.SD]MXV44650.1 phosphotransferase [Saccharibacter sp. 17.LH.SD]